MIMSRDSMIMFDNLVICARYCSNNVVNLRMVSNIGAHFEVMS